MSREMLGATGFESTNLDEIKSEQGFTENLNSDLKGTNIGEKTSLEKQLDLEKKPEISPIETAPLTKTKKNVESTSEEQGKAVEDNEFSRLFNTVKNYKEGDIITGIVSKIVNGMVYVDIAYKAEGIIEPEEISNNESVKASDVCKPGTKIKVQILRLENKAGNPVLSKKRADYQLGWEGLARANKNNEDIQVTVTSMKPDGLNVDYSGISAFIPASQIAREDMDKLDSFIGKTIYAKVLKVHRLRRKVILSQKASREKAQRQVQDAVKNFKPGTTLKGTVSSIKSFGAFVNLGEVDGLVHISELSWNRVEHVEDVLAVGQEVQVYVLGIDESNARISLSIKKLQPDPWEEIEKNFKPGDQIKCKITRLAQFGAFAQVADGVEGLIHLTELSDEKQVKYPEEIVKVGQEVDARILRIDLKNKKIGLSLRASAEIPAAESITETVKES